MINGFWFQMQESEEYSFQLFDFRFSIRYRRLFFNGEEDLKELVVYEVEKIKIMQMSKRKMRKLGGTKNDNIPEK